MGWCWYQHLVHESSGRNQIYSDTTRDTKACLSRYLVISVGDELHPPALLSREDLPSIDPFPIWYVWLQGFHCPGQ